MCNLSWTPHSNLEKDNSLKTTPVLAQRWAVWSILTKNTKDPTLRADHAKTKDYCMARFFGHGQSIFQVFETPIALSIMKSVKSQFFSNPTGPNFVDFSHILCTHLLYT